ncbi:MAG: alpha/beta hydrolase fold domain-containing protein, partial [Clostridia bacterium]|nr:alpha/beta hydrolase fold domain-containing protein [Clostridia bacterium]
MIIKKQREWIRMSLVGMFAKRIMGKKICLNPENEPSGASRLAMLASRTADRRISSKLNCIKCVTADGVKYERISLKNSPKTNKAVYYIHGGAFVAALHPFYRNLATSLSKAAGDAEVIFLDYSTAPEFKYPTQLSEALRVWREITEELGFKADNIFIGGDSAGANLALAMMLRLRDRKEPLPKAGFFISSWADMSAS